jgi:alanine dehydrogenase
VLDIAGKGIDAAISDPALALGVNTWDGRVTNAGVAEAHGLHLEAIGAQSSD